jgi:hypothetical protein
MPTLDDTIEFQATSLNDLLEAEAGAGVVVGAAGDRYRRWAFLATGAAGILAVLLAVTMLTGRGGGGGGSGVGQTAKQPRNTNRFVMKVNDADLGSDVEVGKPVDIRTSASVLAGGGLLIAKTDVSTLSKVAKVYKLEIAVKPEEWPTLRAAQTQGAEDPDQKLFVDRAPACRVCRAGR